MHLCVLSFGSFVCMQSVCAIVGLGLFVCIQTLSFLTYVLRGFAERLMQHQDILCKAVLQLLLTCPHENVNSRKELLVATRHIIATEFRKGFFKRVDFFLDEKTLIGSRSTPDSTRFFFWRSFFVVCCLLLLEVF